MDSAPSARTGHVFISYARDGGAGEEWAGCIQERLEGLGLDCWRDLSAVPPGGDWLEGIPQGLAGASTLVLVVSRAIAERRWVRRELAYAEQQGLPMIPALVEPGAELAFAVTTNRPVDFTADPDRAWGSWRSPWACARRWVSAPGNGS